MCKEIASGCLREIVGPFYDPARPWRYADDSLWCGTFILLLGVLIVSCFACYWLCAALCAALGGLLMPQLRQSLDNKAFGLRWEAASATESPASDAHRWPGPLPTWGLAYGAFAHAATHRAASTSNTAVQGSE